MEVCFSIWRMKSGCFYKTVCPTAASTSELPSSLQEPVQFPKRWNQFLGWKAQTDKQVSSWPWVTVFPSGGQLRADEKRVGTWVSHCAHVGHNRNPQSKPQKYQTNDWMLTMSNIKIRFLAQQDMFTYFRAKPCDTLPCSYSCSCRIFFSKASLFLDTRFSKIK